jgi:hypothetical protein
VQIARRENKPEDNFASRSGGVACERSKKIQWGFLRCICERIRAEAAPLAAIASFFRSLLHEGFTFLPCAEVADSLGSLGNP